MSTFVSALNELDVDVDENVDSRSSISLHQLERRHYFTCGGQTFSWEKTWYTEPFYTAAESSYDSVASTGPVNPPSSIYDTVLACSRALSEESSATFGSSLTHASTITTSTLNPSSTYSLSTSSSQASVVSRTSVVAYTTLPLTSGSATVAPASTTGIGDANNTCAGGMDWQAWGAVAGAFIAIIIGGLIWLIWLILRPKLITFYSPRTWFVRPDLRPSATPNILAFLLPFLNLLSLRSAPLSDGHVFLHLQFAFLKLAGLSSLFALGAALPIITAGVPCLSQTAPTNSLGGRLGSLTDLTLLRLLDSLEPSLEPSSAQAHLRLNRDLSSTIAPTISGARRRLIILLILMTVVAVGGNLFVVGKLYRKLVRHRKRFVVACGGQDMVVFSRRDNPNWKDLSEVALGRSLVKMGNGDIVVNGVFAVPEMGNLRDLVARREIVLDQLEMAEMDFIQKGVKAPRQARPSRVTIAQPPTSESKKTNRLSRQSRLTSFSSTSTGPPITVIPGAHGASGSAFVELDRASIHPDPLRVGSIIPPGSTSLTSPPEQPFHDEETPESSPNETIPTQEGQIASGSGNGVGVGFSPDENWKGPTLQIRKLRDEFIELNSKVRELQESTFADMAMGRGVVGWVVVGSGLKRVGRGRVVEGYTKEDILWENIGKTRGDGGVWVGVVIISTISVMLSIPILGLSSASAPGFAHYLPFLRPLSEHNGFPEALAEGFAPAITLSLLLAIAITVANGLANKVRSVSFTHQRALRFKATFWILLVVVVFWTVIGSLDYAVQGFSLKAQEARSVGDGVSFTTWVIFISLLNVSVVVPGLALLRPKKLVAWLRQRRRVLTPRQRFRLNIPPNFDPSTALTTSLLGVLYAFTLILIFPLLAIPIIVLVYLSLIANHQLVNYVFCNIYGGPDGGILAMWILRRVGCALGLQPLVFGFVLLSRDEWGVGGASLGVAIITVILVLFLTSRSIDKGESEKEENEKAGELGKPSHKSELDGQPQQQQLLVDRRGRLESNQSILALIHSVLPSVSRLDTGNPIPFESEYIDDLVSPRRAAFATPLSGKDEQKPRGKTRSSEEDRECRGESNSEARRRAGSSRGDSGEEGEEVGLREEWQEVCRIDYHDDTIDTRGLIYPPELLSQNPEVWLDDDKMGVGRDEVESLARDGVEAMVDPVR